MTSRADTRENEKAAFITVFLLGIGFTYSDDFAQLLIELQGTWSPAQGRWLFLLIDCLLVAGTAVLMWRISGKSIGARQFLRDLGRGWWALGAVLVVATHLFLIDSDTSQPWVGVSTLSWRNTAAMIVFAIAVTLLLIAALGRSKVGSGWIIPLALGIFVVQIAGAWYPVNDLRTDCTGNVASNYFYLTATLVPTILLTLGIQFNYVSRSGRTGDLGRRVAPILTVALLCMAELLALSKVVIYDTPLCGPGAIWHEYLAFVVSAQALTIGLATIVWLLVSDPVHNSDASVTIDAAPAPHPDRKS